VEYFHFLILVYSGQSFSCPAGEPPPLLVASHSITVSKSSLGQSADCGPFLSLGFAHSVVVSRVIPLFIASVSVSSFGGRAKAD
jgi:hypothetical protein